MCPNNFRHQVYSGSPPSSPYEIVSASFPPQPGTIEFQDGLAEFGLRIREHVDAIVLIHGSFVGEDALGWSEQLGRLWPSFADKLMKLGKRVADFVAGDAGNYNRAFADLLQNGINRDLDRELPVELFNWSSENIHLARGRSAVALLARIFRGEFPKRLHVWAHSHGGNVMALLTNLLNADLDVRDQFLNTIESGLQTKEQRDDLATVRAGLAENRQADIELDIVTFGMPIRYGWEASGFRKLLNIVNHRVQPDQPEYVSAAADFSVSDLEIGFGKGSQGDWVQQLGIASTNFMPFLLDRDLVKAEKQLGQFLEGDLEMSFLERLKTGMRVGESGATLLVEYDNQNGLAKHGWGHSVYTRDEWLAFHAKQIGSRIY